MVGRTAGKNSALRWLESPDGRQGYSASQECDLGIVQARNTEESGVRKKRLSQPLQLVLTKRELHSVPIILANLGEIFSHSIKNRTVSTLQP